MRFEDSHRGYANLWERMKILPARKSLVENTAKRIHANAARYAIGTVPWYGVGIIHHLESAGNFRTHLHNGDPLSARTTHVPSGRPAVGNPPFTWEESAQDALRMHGLFDIESWTVPRVLFELERYNGFGYVSKKINSPYLWSMTDQYVRGKYVADGKYDPNAVSAQVGAAAILRAMFDLGLIETGKVSAMEKIKSQAMPFAGLAPTLVGMLATQLAPLAIKALADVLDIEPDADKVAEALEKAKLQESMKTFQEAEATVQILQPTAPQPPAPTPVVIEGETPKTTPPVSPVDSILGGESLTGWKTIIGIVIMGALTFAQSMGFIDATLYGALMSIGATIFGVGVVAKVDRYFGWIKR